MEMATMADGKIREAIGKYLTLGAARLGKGFPSLYDPAREAEIMQERLSSGALRYLLERAPRSADEEAGMVPLKAKPVPVVYYKPFPDVLGFTDNPMAPLVEWPR
jgi:hypothetical protein